MRSLSQYEVTQNTINKFNKAAYIEYVYIFLQQTCGRKKVLLLKMKRKYEGWNFNSGNYLFTTDTK